MLRGRSAVETRAAQRSKRCSRALHPAGARFMRRRAAGGSGALELVDGGTGNVLPNALMAGDGGCVVCVLHPSFLPRGRTHTMAFATLDKHFCPPMLDLTCAKQKANQTCQRYLRRGVARYRYQHRNDSKNGVITFCDASTEGSSLVIVISGYSRATTEGEIRRGAAKFVNGARDMEAAGFEASLRAAHAAGLRVGLLFSDGDVSIPAVAKSVLEDDLGYTLHSECDEAILECVFSLFGCCGCAQLKMIMCWLYARI